MTNRPDRANDAEFRPRKEAFALSSGSATFVDDIPIAGDWFGGTVRSRIAHGRLAGFRFDPGFDWSRVVLLTAKDIPGTNEVVCHDHDQPSLCDGVIRHLHEPLALVAAPNVDILDAALRAIEPIEDPLPAVFDVEEALKSEVKIFGNDNVFLTIPIRKGDTASAMGRADYVVETVHHTPAQEHAYLETQGMRAEWHDGGVVIEGSMQCPYYLVHGVTKLLGLQPEKVHVIARHTGGGFGGKEDFPTMLAGHTALLARAAGHPVRMIYSRAEDMRSTTKRHPAVIRRRTGSNRDGRIEAVEVEILIDGGAYSTLSPFVLSRAALHAVGPYRCEHVKIDAKAVATNHPPNGGFRGFGCPQVHFATETHIDSCAERIGMDPIAFRRINLLQADDTMPTGQILGADTSIREVFEKALAETRYGERYQEILEANRRCADAVDSNRHVRHGIGLAVFMHGTGLNEYWETETKSRVRLRGTVDGKVEVLTAQAEFGQGTLTTLGRIAAEALGFDEDDIVVNHPDTALVPDSGPTVASRTNSIIGSLICEASDELKRRIVERCGPKATADSIALKHSIAEICRDGTDLTAESVYDSPERIDAEDPWAPHDAYPSYAWSCCVVEVSVDVLTGETRATDVHVVADVGKVIHPTLAAGQVRGGVAQGVGWALTERVVWDDQGGMLNANLSDYAIPSAMDIPDVTLSFLEVASPRSRHGAKGLGELSMEGPAPAIANAVAMAIGRRPDRLPIDPESILDATEAFDR